MMRVSVIVATRNRRESLLRALSALAAQEYPDFEILVADDASTDGTGDVVRALFPAIRYLRRETQGGPAAARNLAIAHSTGDLIAFTDDDCIAPPTWIGEHVAYYDDPLIGAVGGPQVPVEPNIFDLMDMARYAESHFGREVKRVETLQGWEGLATSNMSVRRRIFEEVGPFDEAFLTGADPELTRRVVRAGYHLIVDPALQVEHLKVHTLRSYLITRFRRGCGSVLADIKEGSLSPRRFVPFPHPLGTWRAWRHFRRLSGGGPFLFLQFWGIAIVERVLGVAGRLYYYWTVGRAYQDAQSKDA